MKTLFSLATILLLLSSCSNSSKNIMNVTGEVKGLKKGTLFLQKLNDTIVVSIDSLAIDGDATFQFSEVIESPEVYYLALTFKDSSNVIKRTPFFGEATQIHITTTLENFEQDAKVTGSSNQEKWEEYAALMQRYTDKNLDLIEERFNALKDNNDSLLLDVENRQDKLIISKYLATVNYALNHKEYDVAPYLMITEVYDANVSYLDTIYGVLSPKVKDSKYGKALESLIKDRKK